MFLNRPDAYKSVILEKFEAEVKNRGIDLGPAVSAVEEYADRVAQVAADIVSLGRGRERFPMIQAIKVLRATYPNFGLKQSKDILEYEVAKAGIQWP